MATRKKKEVLVAPEEPETFDELDLDAELEPDFEAEETVEGAA